MCIGVPGRVVKIVGLEGVVETKGVQRKVNLALVQEVRIDDYVLVHAGMAIQIIDENEAEVTLGLLEELFADEEGED